jgi:dihydroorotase
MNDVLLRGGRVIDPASGRDQPADMLLAQGSVAAISTQRGQLTPASETIVIDVEGCLVTPGLLDIHVHLREPSGDRHEETIASGAAAAVAGGFTTVCCMPNTTPPLDSPDRLLEVFRRATAADAARVLPVACATQGRQGERVTDVASLAEAGAIAISDDGDVVSDAGVMREALRAARDANICFMQHCQEPSLTRGASMNAGPVAERMGQIGWPHIAEELIIERDVRLNREIGCRYHAQHLSSGESVEIIRRARETGQPITGEASPHHLLLTDEACEQLGTAAKMNPPLRTAADIAMLKEGIASGVITVLATDHAPHPAASKDVDFAQAAFGIVGVESALPLYVKALVDDGVLSWPELVAMMTINPARLIGIDAGGLGTLTVGGEADVTIIDPDLEWTIDADAFISTGRNCPFDGWSVRGRAIGAIIGGRAKRLIEPGRVVASPGPIDGLDG